MHLLTKGTPFNDLSEGCAVRIKISLYFQRKAICSVYYKKFYFSITQFITRFAKSALKNEVIFVFEDSFIFLFLFQNLLKYILC